MQVSPDAAVGTAIQKYATFLANPANQAQYGIGAPTWLALPAGFVGECENVTCLVHFARRSLSLSLFLSLAPTIALLLSRLLLAGFACSYIG